MAANTKVRVAVIDGHYVSLEEHGVPLPVCIQLHQHRLDLHDAQWTARHSTGGFSVSFFWPTLNNSKPVKSTIKKRRKKVIKQSQSKSALTASSHQKLKSTREKASDCLQSPLSAQHLAESPALQLIMKQRKKVKEQSQPKSTPITLTPIH